MRPRWPTGSSQIKEIHDAFHDLGEGHARLRGRQATHRSPVRGDGGLSRGAREGRRSARRIRPAAELKGLAHSLCGRQAHDRRRPVRGGQRARRRLHDDPDEDARGSARMGAAVPESLDRSRRSRDRGAAGLRARGLRAEPATEALRGDQGAALMSPVVVGVLSALVLGAILLTALFGGGIATHIPAGSPLVTHILFALYLALFVWCGLYLRSGRLRKLMPLTR